ncbi:MAG: ferrochelatase [Gemmatimonadota bacterium]|nr:ferrochelatase [Gemmatimonadota bacterium]
MGREGTGATGDAVLLMAYGTPGRLEDVEAYFTHIRGGRTPSPESVQNLRARYERIGGATPLLQLTEDVRAGLEAALARAGEPRRVYMGMKHWHPYVAETVQTMHAAGVRRLTAVVLAPHYARMSVGGYRKALDEKLAELGNPMEVRFVDHWYERPDFVAFMAGLVREGLARFPEPARKSVTVVFTAHSLPERIRTWNDPYEAQLQESAELVARAAGLPGFRRAWQSAGGTGEPWIGPDILDFLDTLKAEGVTRVLQVPIGFVSDHLEVLYDIDIEAREKAKELGMTLERTRLPNADPGFIEVLRGVARG